jgi:hypothetical protein
MPCVSYEEEDTYPSSYNSFYVVHIGQYVKDLCVCVCERERERERERARARARDKERESVCVCVCLCVYAWLPF